MLVMCGSVTPAYVHIIDEEAGTGTLEEVVEALRAEVHASEIWSCVWPKDANDHRHFAGRSANEMSSCSTMSSS